MRESRLSLLTLSVACQFLVVFFIAVRWQAMLQLPELRLHKYLYFVFLGNFFSFFLPSSAAAEAVKVLAFGHKYGRLQENIGIAIFARAAGLGIQIVLGGTGLFIFNDELRESGLAQRFSLDILPLLVFLSFLVLALTLVWRYKAALSRQIWIATLVRISQDRPMLVRILGWTLLIQILSVIAVYCLFLSIHPQVQIWQVMLFPAIIQIILMLPISFGGVGVREYLNLLFFTDLGRIPPDVTVAVSILGYLPLFLIAGLGGMWMASRRLANGGKAG